MRELLEANPLLKQVLNNIDQVVWMQDLRSDDILYVSPAFEKVWGRSCESFYDDVYTLIKSVHPEDRVKVISTSLDGSRKYYNQSYRILRPDGSLRWIFAHAFLVDGAAPGITYQVCVAEDITDQNEVDQTLRMALDRSREQFTLSRRMSLARKPESVLKTLMSAHDLRPAQHAVLVFFDDSGIGPARGMEVTASWLASPNLPAWTSETLLYEEPALWDLLHPNRTVIISGVQSDPRLAPIVRDFLLEGTVHTFAIIPLVASGDWLGCLMVYYHQEVHLDHVQLRHLKVLVDQAAITLYNLHLLQIEEESRHEAERANEIKTQFLAMISHELRTPLTSIIGFTTTLLAEDVSWDADDQADFIRTIHQEANRLQELIDHLLVLSRLEAGMLPIEVEPNHLEDILHDVTPQFNSLTGGLEVKLVLPANLPSILADGKRIAQVLVNLVRNAVTYSPKETEISISAGVRGNFMQINVNDNGPGIPLAEHKKVFKAFQRGANIESKSAQGAGLGLAICKGLVEAHGGRIWIKKKNAPGATISFTIPLVPVSVPLIAPLEAK